MLGLRLHKRRIIALVAIVTVMISAVVFGASRMISADETRALTYAIPEGYETFKDATLYDCVARAYEATTGETVPSDGLTDEQLALITSLNCPGDYYSEDEKITDATGVERLTGLEWLSLRRNNITTIDVSHSTALWYLWLGENKISELDVRNNTALTEMRVERNMLTSIDLSQNTLLTMFFGDLNNLNSIVLPNSNTLTLIDVSSNNLKAIDTSGDPALEYLDVDSNRITSLDLSNNMVLEDLNVDMNMLTDLVVSNNVQLVKLEAHGNQITGIDLRRNTNLKHLDLRLNQLTELDVSNNLLLELLDVGNNENLTSLDVSGNEALKMLSIDYSGIVGLDLSNNLQLETLNTNMADNLTALDVSNNVGLLKLCFSATNSFSTVDLSHNAALKEVIVYGELLDSLDLSHNANLEYLSVHNTKKLEEIDVRSNHNLKALYNTGDLPIRADISYSFNDDVVIFDLSDLGFVSSVIDKEGYSYDEASKTLTVSDLNKTNGYAGINAIMPPPFVEGSTYVNNKLILSDYVLTLNQNNGSDNTGTLVCLPESESGNSCVVVLPGMDSAAVVEDGATREFLGWADTANATEPQYMANEEMTLTGRKTVYAVWQDVHTYTLNYDLNLEDASASGIESVSCSTAGESCEASVTTVEPTRAGYVFLGWADTANANEGNNDYIAGASITLTGNKTLYAIWAPIYVLSFNANGGNGSVVPQTCNPTTVNGSCEVTIPSDAEMGRDGYWWLGWASSAGSLVAEKQNGDTVTLTDDTTLYAVWEGVVHYTLSFDLNGGAGVIENVSCEVALGATSCNVVIPEFRSMIAPPLPKFLGWSDEASANIPDSAYDEGKTVSLSDDKTIYALWANAYILNYNLGNAESEVIESDVCYPETVDGDCEVTIPKIRPERDGYEFFGWSKTENGTMADYLPGEVYKFSADEHCNQTIYAIWADGEVTWVQGQDTVETDDVDAILVIDYPSRSFVKLFIDGKEVDEKYYTIESENTRITISSEYLEILGPGTHTLEAVYEDDITVKTLFNIEEKEPEIKVPDTGNETHDDNGANVAMFAILPVVVAAMMAVMVWMVLRKYHAMRKW